MGANMLLKVMSGDQLNASVDYYHTVTSADNSTANGLTTLVNSLLAAITGSPSVSAAAKAGAATATTTMGTAGSPVATALAGETASSTTGQPPKAYLHVLLFNEQFVYDNVNSVVQQVSIANAATTITKLVNVKKNGYLIFTLATKAKALFGLITLK